MEHRLCVECGDPLEGRRRRWCSDECVRAYMIRTDPKWARHAVYERDKGVCANCGADTTALREQVKDADRRAAQRALEYWESRGLKRTYVGFRPGARLHQHPRPNSYHHYAREERLQLLTPLGLSAWWWRKTWWDMDHIVAVDERGENCGLHNLQTLCLPCHSARTVGQRRRWRGRSRRLPRMTNEACTSDCKLSDDVLCVGCSRYRRRILAVPQKR